MIGTLTNGVIAFCQLLRFTLTSWIKQSKVT